MDSYISEMFKAVQGDREEKLGKLIAAGCDVDARNEYKMTPLMEASHYGSQDCLGLLIAAGCDVNAKDVYGVNSAMRAAHMGHADCIAKLIEAGCDIGAKNDAGITAAEMAVMRGNTKCAEMLAAAADRKMVDSKLCELAGKLGRVRKLVDQKIRADKAPNECKH